MKKLHYFFNLFLFSISFANESNLKLSDANDKKNIVLVDSLKAIVLDDKYQENIECENIQIKIVLLSVLVFMAINLAAQGASYTLTQDCKGPLNFDIEPSSISPNGQVNFIASGLSDCKGKTIEFWKTFNKAGGIIPTPTPDFSKYE